MLAVVPWDAFVARVAPFATAGATGRPPYPVLVRQQVHFLQQWFALADEVAALPRLRLRGLMAIPEPTNDESLQRARFAQLRGLLESLRQRGHDMDTLSMGMSADLEAAVTEGATIVRIGTAIFGERI